MLGVHTKQLQLVVWYSLEQIEDIDCLERALRIATARHVHLSLINCLVDDEALARILWLNVAAADARIFDGLTLLQLGAGIEGVLEASSCTWLLKD